MTKLANYLEGCWQEGSGEGSPVLDPITGEVLATVSADGLNIARAYDYARQQAGPALRKLSYAGRAALLGEIGKVLQANRDKYYDISLRNSGTVQNDTAVDVDGAIYTLSFYAKTGSKMVEKALRLDGEPAPLAKDNLFASQHIFVPIQGLALFINAFNFPAWGLWEKAAAALLSGVPVVIKPATSTAWLTHEMVKDVVDANILPTGALNIVCGRPNGLLDALNSLDVVSFTGSADTAASLRDHPRIKHDGVRFNAETDSVNSAILGPDADDDAAGLLVREVVRELTIKSGQKCTAIRRIFVPESRYDAVAQAVAAKLKTIIVGDPRKEGVRMGSLVNLAQRDTVLDGIGKLAECSDILFDGRTDSTIDLDHENTAVVPPVLFGVRNPDNHPLVHEMEVFGPVATLIPYRDTEHAFSLARRGMGSLVASVYSNQTSFLAQAAVTLAESHGRVHLINNHVAKAHTGHGNVMPQSNHGGPGRAGGGEELGGLRALRFYHRLAAIQGSPELLDKLAHAAGAES
ncbi:MAG: 3,4-dehydroadipyl-CoA semialdehyde dehydrogenase [Pusillimonas sp.]|nr:3,4-dehydroadipyl-CoA semialdehyde dehydrogenase [Pusillimonas sp.]